MKNVIEQIKRKHPIAPFVAPYTRGLKNSDRGRGKWFVGYCPFHEHGYDRPNFWVNVETGLCNCFVPSCASEKPMDVINFWARFKGISNLDAIGELLA